MSARVSILVNGQVVQADADTSVAAALLNSGTSIFRRSVGGEPRAPLCGMGVCFDCRVTIGRDKHVRACLVKVHEGMEVNTDS